MLCVPYTEMYGRCRTENGAEGMGIEGVYDFESSKLHSLALVSSFGVRRRSDGACGLPGNNACVNQVNQIHPHQIRYWGRTSVYNCQCTGG